MDATNEDLERTVTEGQVTYVNSIVFNEDQKNLTLIFERIWDGIGQIYKRLLFLDVQNFQEVLNEDFDKDCIDMLLGIEVQKTEETINYAIITTERELMFSSKTPFIVEKID